MTAIAPAIDEMTLTVTQEIHVRAPLAATFAALLEELGPSNQSEAGAPMPMVLEPWPGGRWFRDLGDKNGHLWGHVQAIKRPTLLEITGPLMMSFAAVSNVQYRLKEARRRNPDHVPTLGPRTLSRGLSRRARPGLDAPVRPDSRRVEKQVVRFATTNGGQTHVDDPRNAAGARPGNADDPPRSRARARSPAGMEAPGKGPVARPARHARGNGAGRCRRACRNALSRSGPAVHRPQPEERLRARCPRSKRASPRRRGSSVAWTTPRSRPRGG